VEKAGKLRVVHSGLKDEKTRFLEDIFTTCVDMRWRYISLGTHAHTESSCLDQFLHPVLFLSLHMCAYNIWFG
jgi:hypothetical protein